MDLRLDAPLREEWEERIVECKTDASRSRFGERDALASNEEYRFADAEPAKAA